MMGCVSTEFKACMKYKACRWLEDGGILSVVILITSLDCNASWETSASGIS